MLKPTLEKAKELTGYSVIPVCREILSDFTTPIEVLKKLRRVSRHVYILESVENQEKWGRYTFLGYNPKLELTCTNGELTVKDVVTGKTETSHQAHPAAYIKELMKKYTSPKLEGFPSFTGGLVGYFSYDYIKYSEPTLNLDAKDEERFKDVDLMLFDKVIAYDHLKQKIVLVVNMKTDSVMENYGKACAALEGMAALINDQSPLPPLKATGRPSFTCNVTEAQYADIVDTVFAAPDQSQVPVGSLSYKTDQADTSVVLNPYEFDWQWQTEDGQTSTSQVDGSAADGNGTLNETIVDARIPNAVDAFVAFSVNPTSSEIERRPLVKGETAKIDPQSDGEDVPCTLGDDGTAALRIEPNYLYEVKATFPQGEAEYAFYTID